MTPRARLLSSPSCVMTMAWTFVAVPVTRRRLRRDGLGAVAPSSAWLPISGEPGVIAMLNRLERTCLERSLLLQRWLADHGRPLDLVIGVKADPQTRAHAWLEAEEPDGYADIYRLQPPARRNG